MAAAAAAAPASIHPRTVEDIFKDFSARRVALIRALTTDVDRFYLDCDPEKDNLSLYAHPNGTWEVALPAEEVPPEVPEPALGINFARDGMNRREWLSLVAMHADTWLLAIAFYFGAHLNRNDRKRLFTMMNELPNVYEVVTERNPSKDKPGVDSGTMAKPGTKRPSDGHLKRNVKRQAVTYEEEEDEEEEEEEDDGGDDDDDDHGETLCGSCGGNYNSDEFWICCDKCEKWFHGKCVKITPARAEHIKHYKCPSCSTKKSR